MSLKFLPKGPNNNIPSLFQIMAWRRSGDKPLSEPMMISWLTHICVTRPQWVNMTRRYMVSNDFLLIFLLPPRGHYILISWHTKNLSGAYYVYMFITWLLLNQHPRRSTWEGITWSAVTCFTHTRPHSIPHHRSHKSLACYPYRALRLEATC